MTDRLRGRELTRLRAEWSPRVAARLVACWRCGLTIEPTEPWDLGHALDLSLGGAPREMTPEHRHASGPCAGNRSAGAKLGHQLKSRPRRRLAEWLR
jgi:hypothetical protein